MKHVSIGGLDVSRIGLGAMSMAGYYNIREGSDAESIRAIHRALDLGVTHLDTAEIYGPYTNEELVGRAIKDRRDQVVLATNASIHHPEKRSTPNHPRTEPHCHEAHLDRRTRRFPHRTRRHVDGWLLQHHLEVHG